jgi:large subunit ribosomal protein L35Ae
LNRLYQKAVFLHFKRGQRTQQENQAILKIQNVNERKSARFYHGKRVAYIYRAEDKKRGTHFKASWGKVIGNHGNSGLVKAKFAKNLPPRAMGATLRVMLYPNRTL